MDIKFLQILMFVMLVIIFPIEDVKANTPEEKKDDPRYEVCQNTCWEIFQAMTNRITVRSVFLSADERGTEASDASNEWRACLEACEASFGLSKKCPVPLVHQ